MSHNHSKYNRGFRDGNRDNYSREHDRGGHYEIYRSKHQESRSSKYEKVNEREYHDRRYYRGGSEKRKSDISRSRSRSRSRSYSKDKHRKNSKNDYREYKKQNPKENKKNRKSRSRSHSDRSRKYSKNSRSRSYSKSSSSSSSDKSSYKALKKPINSQNNPSIPKTTVNKVVIENEDEFDMSKIPSAEQLVAITSQMLKNQKEQNNKKQKTKKSKDRSNTLMISNLGPDINLELIEDIFREKCLDLQTSMPEDVKFLESLRMAYVIFPSISTSVKVYNALNGSVLINGNYYEVGFTPHLKKNNTQNNSNKAAMTYVHSVSDANAMTTSLETTVHEDWICEFCELKNFSKRSQCYRCKKPKTMNCRVVPIIRQKTTVVGENGQVPPCSSLMIKGNILKNTNESELFMAFSLYGHVKDVRLIQDKVTGEPRDYAFIEFFSVEESCIALNLIKQNPVKVRGQPIFCTFSKIRKPEDYKELNENSRNLNTTSTLNQMYPGGLQIPQSIPNASLTFNSMINSSNLSPEEQAKLQNISNLQNMIHQSKNQINSFTVKETKGESNLRKEKELTEREKIELEMKKWRKEQTKMEKEKRSQAEVNPASLKNYVLNYEHVETVQNEYESIISLDKKMNDIINNSISDFSTEVSKQEEKKEEVKPENNDSVICEICQRKFPNEEKLKIHENLSSLHKDNLKKLGLLSS